MFEKIREGKADIYVPVGEKISAELPVFYNPLMELNRTVSLILLNSLPNKNIQIGLPLEGSGVRGIRFLKELKKGILKNISLNDHSERAVENIRGNLKLNKLNKKNIFIFQLDANDFLRKSKGFDYIDIDPFGTPNPFLESSILRLSREGVLAVTATDTGCLCGSYPEACGRKYFAKPLKNEFMHETGLRILIRKVQLIGTQYSRALVPIFSFSKDHYFRGFFISKKGKQKADKLLDEFGYILFCPKCLSRKTSAKPFVYSKCCGEEMEWAGPLWLGRLWDEKLARKMIENSDDKTVDFLNLIREESKVGEVGFFNIHQVIKMHNFKKIPKSDELIEIIKRKGFKCSRTHFDDVGIRTNADLVNIVSILKKFQ